MRSAKLLDAHFARCSIFGQFQTLEGERLLCSQRITHREIQRHWHATLETEKALLEFSKHVDAAGDRPGFFRIGPLVNRCRHNAGKLDIEAEGLAQSQRLLVLEVKRVLVLIDLDRRTIDYHIFEDEEVNMSAVLSRPNHDGDLNRDSERRSASEHRLPESNQLIRFRV